MIVPADVDRLPLRGEQLGVDLLLVVAQFLGDLGEPLRDPLVLRLRGQGLRPIEREIEMAAAVVDLADLTGR